MADLTPDASIGVRDDAVVEAVLRERAVHLSARDGAAETDVLAGLAQALADTPEHVLQSLADALRALCGADAVVVAVRDGTDDAGGETVRWCVVSGVLAGHEGERWGMDECACGTVIRADGAVLMEQPADKFPSLRASGVDVAEFLGVPWRIQGGVAGALGRYAESMVNRFDSVIHPVWRALVARATVAGAQRSVR